MTEKPDERTITIGQIKAMALLMTHAVREDNSSREWVRGIDYFVERIVDYIKACE